MTQSNCNTCEYKHITVDDIKSYGHCYMFAEEPKGFCGYHSELPIKGLCNLAYLLAQMDVDDNVPESVESSFEAVRDWLLRFAQNDYPQKFDIAKFNQRIDNA